MDGSRWSPPHVAKYWWEFCREAHRRKVLCCVLKVVLFYNPLYEWVFPLTVLDSFTSRISGLWVELECTCWLPSPKKTCMEVYWLKKIMKDNFPCLHCLVLASGFSLISKLSMFRCVGCIFLSLFPSCWWLWTKCSILLSWMISLEICNDISRFSASAWGTMKDTLNTSGQKTCWFFIMALGGIIQGTWASTTILCNVFPLWNHLPNHHKFSNVDELIVHDLLVFQMLDWCYCGIAHPSSNLLQLAGPYYIHMILTWMSINFNVFTAWSMWAASVFAQICVSHPSHCEFSKKHAKQKIPAWLLMANPTKCGSW